MGTPGWTLLDDPVGSTAVYPRVHAMQFFHASLGIVATLIVHLDTAMRCLTPLLKQPPLYNMKTKSGFLRLVVVMEPKAPKQFFSLHALLLSPSASFSFTFKWCLSQDSQGTNANFRPFSSIFTAAAVTGPHWLKNSMSFASSQSCG